MPNYPQQSQSSSRTEEQAYDEIPYESCTHAQTQPARIAAIAQLFGLKPHDVETARVLELGCASGGNLIPLAAHFPKAQFVGVDISGKQIADGQRMVKELGLPNITLKHLDIAALSPGDGCFDYIICHGIYSWVPAEVRDDILRVCNDNLSEDGVALISYNTLPGWHFVQPVRDMMLYWTEGVFDPKEKVRIAREVLDSVKDIAGNLFGPILCDEADHLKTARDAYFLHDHLEQVNAPCYFKDFVAHAGRHSLAYLCELNFRRFDPLQQKSLMIELVDKYADNDVVRAEQYMDFVRQRRFRQTLLVKQSLQSAIDRSTPLTRLEGLHFRLGQKLSKEDVPPAWMRATWRYESLSNYFSGAISITAPSLATARVLDWLVSEATDASTFTLKDLVAIAAATTTDGSLTMEERNQIAELVWEMMNTSLLLVYACPMHAPVPSAAPAATALASASAKLDNNSTSNVFHDRIRLSQTDRKLLLLLDGKQTPAQLAQDMGLPFTEESIREDLKKLAKHHLLC